MKYLIVIKEKGRGGDQYTLDTEHTNIDYVAAHIDALITEDLRRGTDPPWYSVEVVNQ